jgi:hypothetical protein
MSDQIQDEAVLHVCGSDCEMHNRRLTQVGDAGEWDTSITARLGCAYPHSRVGSRPNWRGGAMASACRRMRSPARVTTSKTYASHSRKPPAIRGFKAQSLSPWLIRGSMRGGGGRSGWVIRVGAGGTAGASGRGHPPLPLAPMMTTRAIDLTTLPRCEPTTDHSPRAHSQAS